MSVAANHVEAVRRFNRLYTRQIGVLNEGLLNSSFSLTEVRVLYELANNGATTATALGNELGLDAGYLSRILRRFQDNGLIERSPAESDARQMVLSLTDKGRREFEPLDKASNAEVDAMLAKMTDEEQRQLLGAMQRIERILHLESPAKGPFVLRPHQPGDMGWVVHRHGVLYAQEYGWDERFEALVAEIAAEFIQNFDPKRERCWIAERDGEVVGSVFLVKKDDEIAKLRLLLVEPKARGLGIGKRLVDECIRFAKHVGYKKITLWTQSNLTAARHIYEESGFQLVSQQKHKSFGKELVAETWDKNLA
jgi:DNA-binding MarR family transcriptional regulator/N-acetylglutamate synthase-like GNAT family acetyltransferase